LKQLVVSGEISNKFIIFGLIGISIIAFFIRFLYFPYDAPFSLDATTYFSYAYEIARDGRFPENFILPNNGWPVFLSVFFRILETGEFQTFVDLQRTISIVISIITIIPMYFLCRNFFGKMISFIGASLLILEPRVISNSILGITEPLFNLLIITSLVFFFNKTKWFYLSFATLALATIIRYEGLLLLIPFLVMVLVKFRKDNKKKISVLLCLGIFILVLFPMTMIKIDTMGTDGTFSHVSTGMNVIFKHVIQGNPPESLGAADFPGEKNTFRLHNFLGDSFSKMFFSLGLIQIPIFFLFLPIGIFFLFRKDKIKNMNYKHVTLILFLIFASLTMLYAHGRGIMELRYYLILYPIIILLCCFGIQKINGKINSKILLSLVLGFTIIISFSYMEYNKIDYEFEREAFEITSIAVDMSNKINANSLHGYFITTAGMTEDWPDLKRPSISNELKISPYIVCHFNDKAEQVCDNNSDSLEEFISKGKDNGLDHIVVDNLEHGPEFIQDIFDNEEKYFYLEKVFDSKEKGYKYFVKIFKIDFEIFEEKISNKNE